IEFAAGQYDAHKPLEGKIVGIYFRGPSTRTRTSFTVGALKLGAQIVVYGPNDMQLVTGETIEDTGRILSCFLDNSGVNVMGTVHQVLPKMNTRYQLGFADNSKYKKT